MACRRVAHAVGFRRCDCVGKNCAPISYNNGRRARQFCPPYGDRFSRNQSKRFCSFVAVPISVALYEKGGRAELAQQEREEIAIITAYLPQQMSEDEVKAAIALAVQDVGAAGMKDMGKVIGALKSKYAGRMDFAKASALVKTA